MGDARARARVCVLLPSSFSSRFLDFEVRGLGAEGLSDSSPFWLDSSGVDLHHSLRQVSADCRNWLQANSIWVRGQRLEGDYIATVIIETNEILKNTCPKPLNSKFFANEHFVPDNEGG